LPAAPIFRRPSANQAIFRMVTAGQAYGWPQAGRQQFQPM
jgi:hypothetical protein